ncbi:hypothetical protein M9458_020445, partial [Cirrhinus mrigala]
DNEVAAVQPPPVVHYSQDHTANNGAEQISPPHPPIEIETPIRLTPITQIHDTHPTLILYNHIDTLHNLRGTPSLPSAVPVPLSINQKATSTLPDQG